MKLTKGEWLKCQMYCLYALKMGYANQLLNFTK